MSISSTTRKAGPYTGNAVTTAFPFNFKVFATTDVVVTRTDLSAVETTLTLTTDYTVSLNANQDSNPGGTVTLVTVPPAGYLVTISSAVPALQGNTFTNNGGWYPAVMNDELDRLTILSQQNAEKVSRAVLVPISSSTDPNALIAQLNADAASAAASATAAANSATAAANAVPAGSLGYTPVNKAGDTMTGNLALPGINVGSSGLLTALGSAASKTVGARTGNVPLWDYLPLNSRNAQGAAYSVLVGDLGKLIDATTGTWALTMNPATLGANFAFAARNSGTGVITLTPSTGTINGAATATLNAGESCLVFCDGTNFETVGGGFTGIGYGQTWQDVSASRAIGTTYYNTTGRPIEVNVGQYAATSTGLQINVNGVNHGYICAQTGASGVGSSVAVTIPPGNNYSVSGTGTIGSWLELR